MIRFALAILALLTNPAAAQDPRGRLAFEECRSCHSVEPGRRDMAGPNLAGLIGRRVGGDADFDYSPVLRAANAAGETWDEERLARFLADPSEVYPGLWMGGRGVTDADDRAALVRFLAGR